MYLGQVFQETQSPRTMELGALRVTMSQDLYLMQLSYHTAALGGEERGEKIVS
jgi:hypothetical protein